MCEDFWMMQLVVAAVTASLGCARLVRAMAALISRQYVSSFLCPFCVPL